MICVSRIRNLLRLLRSRVHACTRQAVQCNCQWIFRVSPRLAERQTDHLRDCWRSLLLTGGAWRKSRASLEVSACRCRCRRRRRVSTSVSCAASLCSASSSTMSSSSLWESTDDSNLDREIFGDFSRTQVAALLYTAVRRKRKADIGFTCVFVSPL